MAKNARNILKGPRNRGWATYWPLIFSALCASALGYAVLHPPQYPISEEHNVKILSHPEPNEWLMSDDEQGEFRYRGCSDFPNDTVIWVGYIAKRAKWEERGKCKSIRDTGLGFWWETDGHGNVKEIAYANRAAGQIR